MVSLERVSGVIVLLFVLAHGRETLPMWTGRIGVRSSSTVLVEHLSSTSGGVPWIALGYLVGIAATVFHLVNGMTSYIIASGVASTPAAQRVVRRLSWGGGAFVFAMGAATVVELATGALPFVSEHVTSRR